MTPWLEKLAARHNYELKKLQRVDRDVRALDERYRRIDSSREIVVTGTLDRPSLNLHSKVSPELYFPALGETAAALGIKVRLVPDPRDLAGLLRRFANPLFVLVYNEETSDREMVLDVAFLLERSRPEALIVNHPRTCLTLGDKKQVHELYTKNGIPMPARITAAVAGEAVFSNETAGSGASIRLLRAGEALDDGRYNTAYVDTVHQIAGTDYHVCLRALAVGGDCISAFARARPVADGDASVHAKNTPVDAALMNHLDEQVVRPNLPKIREICADIGRVQGLGCYVHDILPCRTSGQLLVCESGLKFDDRTIRQRMAPIAALTPVFADMVSGEESRAAARSLIRQAEQAGWLP